MKQSGTNETVIEFYRQLELLVRSRLPLPEALTGMRQHMPSREFRSILETVISDLRDGMPLSKALGKYPNVFEEIPRRLIEIGEERDILEVVLHDIVQLAEQRRRITVDLREIAAYPALTILVAMILVLSLLRFYIPEFGHSVQELLETPLPAYSAAVVHAGEMVTALWQPILFAMAAAVVAAIWLFSDTRSAQRAIWKTLAHAPLGAVAANAHELARLCTVWSVFTRRGEPLPVILDLTGRMTENPSLARQLLLWKKQCENGKSLRECAETENTDTPAILATVLRTTREEALAEELGCMGTYYAEEAQVAVQRFKLWWQVVTFSIMALVVAFCIVSMFMPVIQLYRQIAGTSC